MKQKPKVKHKTKTRGVRLKEKTWKNIDRFAKTVGKKPTKLVSIILEGKFHDL